MSASSIKYLNEAITIPVVMPTMAPSNIKRNLNFFLNEINMLSVKLFSIFKI